MTPLFSHEQILAIANELANIKPEIKQYVFGSPNFASDMYIWTRTVRRFATFFYGAHESTATCEFINTCNRMK